MDLNNRREFEELKGGGWDPATATVALKTEDALDNLIARLYFLAFMDPTKVAEVLTKEHPELLPPAPGETAMGAREHPRFHEESVIRATGKPLSDSEYEQFLLGRDPSTKPDGTSVFSYFNPLQIPVAELRNVILLQRNLNSVTVFRLALQGIGIAVVSIIFGVSFLFGKDYAAANALKLVGAGLGFAVGAFQAGAGISAIFDARRHKNDLARRTHDKFLGIVGQIDKGR
jgi:hypothetical protein